MKPNKQNFKLIALVAFFILAANAVLAQERATIKEIKEEPVISLATVAEMLETDENIDVQEYHLKIDIDIDAETISGDVMIQLTPTVNNLNSVKLNLHDNLAITSITDVDGVTSYTRLNNVLTINLNRSYGISEIISLNIVYGGTPPLAPGTYLDKGFRFDKQADGTPAIATYSTPYLSHYWFPCKDGTSDKADKLKVEITIPDVQYNGSDLIAVSNGLLKETISANGKKTFKWEHNYPIVPYYVMVSVSNYTVIERTYANAGNGHNFPITYHIFPPNVSESMASIDKIPLALDVFINYFGDYPFKDEKLGFTQIAQLWAIENQTNTIIGSMKDSWFIGMVHELSHMWFANSITNQTWQHVWLNEGFATYAEALYYDYTRGIEIYRQHLNNMIDRFNYNDKLFKEDVSNYNTVFSGIYYDKGAWVLHMLRGYLGDDVFFNCIKAYAQSPQFKYQHATTEDFRDVCKAISGVDLDTFFEQWVYDKSYPLYKHSFTSDVQEGKTNVTIYQAQSDLYGEREVFEMYLEIQLFFEDGTNTIERVFNNQKIQIFEFEHEKLVTKILVDPNKWVLWEKAVSTLKQITSFEIEGQISSVIDQNNYTVTVTMPFGTNLTELTPTIITSDKAIVSPLSGEAQDFSTGTKTYTVKAEDNSTQNYIVNIVYAANTENKIISFTIEGQVGETVIDQIEKTIKVTMPFGSNITALQPEIVVSANATVSPETGAAQDFSAGNVTYTVTAENLEQQTYNASVIIAPNSENKIISFNIVGQVGETVIDQIEKTIMFTMPFGSNNTALQPEIVVSANATVSPESGAAQDFSAGNVTYTVTAENLEQQTYTASVIIAANSENKIISFTIEGQVGETVINQIEKTIMVTMPFGSNITALQPEIVVSANATVSPESGAAQDFSAGNVTYTVTAENLEQQTYTASVIIAPNSENKIISFTIEGQIGESVIDQSAYTVEITMPKTTNLTAISPIITVSENATISPESGATVDFSNVVIYTVKAENGVTQDWTISVKLDQTSYIDDLKKNLEVVIFPNPTSDVVEIKSSQLIKTIGLIKIDGSQIKTIQVNTTNYYTLNLNEYGKGVLILKITLTDGSVVIKKVVVDK